MKKLNLLIFGSTGGLGTEICKKFSKFESNIFSVSTSKTKNLILKKKLNKISQNSKIYEYVCDVLNENQIRKAVKTAYKKLKKIDIVIITIGFARYDGLMKLSYKQLIHDFKINLFSNLVINSEIVKCKKSNHKMKIINIGSSSAYYGFKDTITYCSSKHGLLGAIRSMNYETIKKNIFNYYVSMGSMKTKAGKKVRNQNYKKFIHPADIADYIFYIANFDSNSYIEDVFFRRYDF